MVKPTPTEGELLELDPLELKKKDLELAEKAWNRLGLDEQVRRLLATAPERRYELCELAHDLPALIHALPEQEAWLSIQALDGSEALAIFQHTTPDQVQFFLDVECWMKDQWLPEPTFEWMRLIAAAGIEKILQFFQQCDLQLVGLLMRRWVCIYIQAKDEDPADAIAWPREEAPFTVDGKFYLQVVDERIDQWLRPMLQAYAKGDHEGYMRLIKELMGLSMSEQEEIAYQHRTRRLAETGFPDWDEAIGVYRQWAEKDFTKIARRCSTAGMMDDRAQVSFALVPMRDANLLLREAIALASSDIQGLCSVELARMANRVVIADGRQISVASVRTALSKAIGYVNIGLEHLSDGTANDAARILDDYWMTGLFQVGYSVVMHLAKDARTWLAANPTERIEDDDPTTPEAIAIERVRAASWKWPKFYLGPQAPDGILHRDFQSREDIATIQDALIPSCI